MDKKYDFSDFDAPSEYDFSDFDAPKDGFLETLQDTGIGAAQGFAAGAADNIAAGVETVYDSFTSDKPILDNYRTNLEKYKKLVAQARERSPIASTVGNVAGSFVGPAALLGKLGAAGGLLKASLGSAVGGGVIGFNESDADITKLIDKPLDESLPEIGQAAGDIALGAGIGAVAPAAIKSVTAGVKKVGKGITDTVKGVGEYVTDRSPSFQLAQDAYKTAETTMSPITGKKAGDLVEKETSDLISGITEDTKRVIKENAAVKKEVFNKVGSGNNVNDDLVNLLNSTDNQLKTVTSNDDLLKSRKIISEKINLIKDQASPEKLDELADEMYSYAKTMDGKDPDSFKQYMDTYSKLKDLTKKSMEGITDESGNDLLSTYLDANNKITNLKNSMTTVSNKFNKSGVLVSDKSEIDFMNFIKGAEKSPENKTKLNNYLKYLREGSPELADIAEQQIPELSKRRDFVQESQKFGMLQDIFTGTGRGTAIKAGETAASITRPFRKAASASTNIMSAGKNYLVDNTPEQITTMASKLAAKGESKYSSLLQSISEKPQQSRNAMLFSLMQRPEFRKIVGEDNDTE
jgi:hypothetical protein